MITKYCLIIPVHREKVNWLYFFLDSIRAHATSPSNNWEFDIALAASTPADAAFFHNISSTLPFCDRVKIVCVEDQIRTLAEPEAVLAMFASNWNRAIINLKKAIALQWAVTAGYEWAAVVDSDVLAIRDLSEMFAALIRNYQTDLYLATVVGETTLFAQISKACRELFAPIDQLVIGGLTKGDRLYSWFFDVPFYNIADFREFRSDMAELYGSPENWLLKQTWYTFDHIQFLYWRCVNKNCCMQNYTELGVTELPERLSATELQRIGSEYDYHPGWVSLRTFLSDIQQVQEIPGLYMLSHTDRL